MGVCEREIVPEGRCYSENGRVFLSHQMTLFPRGVSEHTRPTKACGMERYHQEEASHRYPTPVYSCAKALLTTTTTLCSYLRGVTTQGHISLITHHKFAELYPLGAKYGHNSSLSVLSLLFVRREQVRLNKASE